MVFSFTFNVQMRSCEGEAPIASYVIEFAQLRSVRLQDLVSRMILFSSVDIEQFTCFPRNTTSRMTKRCALVVHGLPGVPDLGRTRVSHYSRHNEKDLDASFFIR